MRIEVGFDEQTYLSQIGLFKVKSHLELLLSEKYQLSLAPTLKALEDHVKNTELELSQVKKELQQHNISVIFI
jgi:hypothetical protein